MNFNSMEIRYYNSRIIVIFMLLITTFSCLAVNKPAFGFTDFEKKLIFYPVNKNMSPVRLSLNTQFQDTYFYSLDGIKLNAWYIKAQNDKPTIIYCHGQGENISMWQSVAQFLADNGYGVFMIDYRGHGRSEGEPSETGLYTDLESAIKYLHDYENINKNNIILWGRSLGGAVVADVASRDSFKGIILESTFTNIRDAAIHLTSTGILESKLSFWQKISTKFVRFMPFTQTFRTDQKISRIKSPLLIAASVNDTTIPSEMSYKLSRINPDAQLYISKKGSHHDSEWVKPRVLEFLHTLNPSSH